MGQYDYQGTPQSRMYDWLVTREGQSLALCAEGGFDEIEAEDLEYIRELVQRDVDYEFIDPLEQIKDTLEAAGAIRSEPVPERDPDAPAPATGGVDYYDMVDPTTGKKKGLPQALGPAPPPTRRYLDGDNQWQEGDRPPFSAPVEDPPDEPAGPTEIRKALGLDPIEEEEDDA